MRHQIARFRLKASASEQEIIAFVARVADEPGTLRYESFREPDGSYLNLMSFADDEAEREHRESAHYQQFAAVCESPPEFADLKKISGAGR